MEIIEKILEWPVIIQGALGSFLFWLILVIGQKGFLFISKKLSNEKNLGHSFARMGRENFRKGNFQISNYSLLVAIYGALHYFLKFVLIVFVAYIFEQTVPVFGYVGYIISFYFFFRALTYVPHFSVFEKEDSEKEASQQDDEPKK